MFDGILVPVDLAAPDVAGRAIEEVTRIARAFSGDVRLIYVVNSAVAMLPMEYVPKTYFYQLGAEEKMRLGR